MGNNQHNTLNHLSSFIYKFICDYRNYSKWYFYDNEVTDLDSVKKLLDNDDNGIDFMSDLSEMFYHFTVHKDFNNPKEAEFFDNLCSIYKEYNSYINSPEKEYDLDSLANDLVQYAKNFDTYEYRDVYNSDEDAFNDMKKNLATTSGIDTMIEWLCNDIHYFASEKDLGNNEISDLSKEAFNLITKLNQYSKVLEKSEDKEMDIQ